MALRASEFVSKNTEIEFNSAWLLFCAKYFSQTNSYITVIRDINKGLLSDGLMDDISA